MPRVGREQELRILTECQYSHPAETLSDLQQVQSRFSDLRLYVNFYCFPNKEKRRLVYLAGTIPVRYEGLEYNIPVCIWLHETHPVSRPRCCVCPSISMVINPSCPCVDSAGNISLSGLSNWTNGVSTLSLLISEMRQAFQKDTPLYARCCVQASAAVQVSQLATGGSLHLPSSSSSSGTYHHLSAASQWEQSSQGNVRRSYTEDLLGIDFSAPPSSTHSNPFLISSYSDSDADPLSRKMEALRVSSEGHHSDWPVEIIRSEVHRDRYTMSPKPRSGLDQDRTQEPHSEPDYSKMATHLPPNQAAMFLSLMRLEGRSFSLNDAMEAVQLNRDFSSALRFLSHNCPICQDQVTFSKIITMTHCSCFLCQTCFKTFFSAAIKERSIDQLVCPQCGRPEIRGQGGVEEFMDYFNLLDTQIRHFLPPHLHELFQRKLRDRALQEMPNFCWCAHCSFGILHEAEQLRMDCPSCKKSTCSQCRSPWSPQHQGLTCQQFKVWQDQQDQYGSALLNCNSIECPNCRFVFSLSKGGCLHFTCSQCQAQFCGGCSQAFLLGTACDFSADCGTKGLHAHHPRDCLYHLRDWTVSRLHLLLQYYRVSPFWLEPASNESSETSRTGACLVLELRDDGSRWEEPCGRPALTEYRGYCQLHYKERLVELINHCHADPAVIFSLVEMKAELQRWHVAVPTREPDEPDTLTNRVPLRKQRCSPLKLNQDLCLLKPAMATKAPPPQLLLTD
ncbi:E3 ubiquitin-protein ligase RNF31 isoform X3 [Betta splendens]|uniref:E3 ubiquitin-protein ligase RNF31 isoform X3 n=1 Tax=Betta splendens TaxID=158456 RepID=A0A9W2XDL4_BETSP|nr:E3 ubiquitin-protein ligase RNF31 isoform X3 [Betta splendens]